MKKLLFTFFILALALCLAQAQRTLTPALESYRSQITAKAGKVLHMAGFDATPEEAASQVNMALQLDSTMTFAFFDTQHLGDSFPVAKTRFRYPAPGVRIEENWEMQIDLYWGIWYPTTRNTFFHDELGRLVEVLAQQYDGEISSYKNDSRIEIFPRKNTPELIDSFFISAWNDTTKAWEQVLLSFNTFDEQDRLLETRSALYLTADSLVTLEVFYYDDKGDNVLTERFDVMKDRELIAGKTETKYVNRQPVEIIEFEHSTGSFLPKRRTTLAYTPSGNLMQQRAFEIDAVFGLAWEMTQEWNYWYDQAGRPISTQISALRENSFVMDSLSYEYVEGDNLYRESAFFRDNATEDWTLDTRKYFYYARPTSVRQPVRPVNLLAVSPNPTFGEFQLQLEEPVAFLLFDASGQIHRTLQVEPGERIDLSDMPAGIYFLSGKGRKYSYTAKVIKQ